MEEDQDYSVASSRNPVYRAYAHHRKNAERRGIEFLLTFSEWFQLWAESGHLNEKINRSRNHKYVMSRFKDRGPYAVGNVRIVTQRENNLEAWNTKTSEEQEEWLSKTGLAERSPETLMKLGASISKARARKYWNAGSFEVLSTRAKNAYERLRSEGNEPKRTRNERGQYSKE